MTDSDTVVRLYVKSKWTLRRISKRLSTDHHRIERILSERGIVTNRVGHKRIPVSKETRAKFSAAKLGKIPVNAWKNGHKTWNRSRKAPLASRWQQVRIKMKLGAKFDLSRYTDIDRFLFLSRLISKHRNKMASTQDGKRDAQMAFIERFYFDPVFNLLYERWLAEGKCRWHRPSIEHIFPVSKGGTFDLDNLCFLTWFENRAKADMTLEEWNQFKTKTKTSSLLFV